jgi:hypothetical protein
VIAALNRFGDFGAQSHLTGESACPTKTRINVEQTLSAVNPSISAIVPKIGQAPVTFYNGGL